MAKACAAFPNSAPNLSKNPGVFRLWCEMLADIDGGFALNNLHNYIRSKNYFPDIADIVRLDLQEQADPEQQKIDTTLLLEQKEEWWENATPPPDDILKKWGSRR